MSGFAALTLAALIVLIIAAGVSMVLPRRKSAGNGAAFAPAFVLIAIGLSANAVGLQAGTSGAADILRWLSPFAVGMGAALLLSNLRADKAPPSGGTSE
ncbi:MAG: hypothetical protein B7Z44_02115 [Caulobacter sp. 12-67-6]|nr:MAG: hypothetical protein B7Z44_02115 [Caulobacter sp. 12-67-6]OYX73682.1 MAG: hypothetical protein B7Y81_02065 [Caulobacter sp. 32-67-35]OYX92870.1 MAG: hypothetical protein B7Y78_09490 [Caulobacter sp. 35-67-4]OZA83075.1 MAG: hypothetical protein B7X77_01150 [Caulobacter sp. 39-67-4]HQR91495.1 hypothetical protein [Caulobacter sp.]